MLIHLLIYIVGPSLKGGIMLPESDALCPPSDSATILPKLALFTFFLLLILEEQNGRLFGIRKEWAGE